MYEPPDIKSLSLQGKKEPKVDKEIKPVSNKDQKQKHSFLNNPFLKFYICPFYWLFILNLYKSGQNLPVRFYCFSWPSCLSRVLCLPGNGRTFPGRVPPAEAHFKMNINQPRAYTQPPLPLGSCTQGRHPLALVILGPGTRQLAAAAVPQTSQA